MKFDDGIPTRQPCEPPEDSPYVAALRPLAALAFLPTVNHKTKQCQMCGSDMIGYSRRKVCCDCYPAFARLTQAETRRRAKERERIHK